MASKINPGMKPGEESKLAKYAGIYLGAVGGAVGAEAGGPAGAIAGAGGGYGLGTAVGGMVDPGKPPEQSPGVTGPMERRLQESQFKDEVTKPSDVLKEALAATNAAPEYKQYQAPLMDAYKKSLYNDYRGLA